MEPTNPQFNSKQLQEEFKKASVHIDGYFLNLDSVSEDIRALEAYLQKSGIKHLVQVEIFKDFPFYIGLDWAECPKEGRWRVMHNYTNGYDRGLNPDTGQTEVELDGHFKPLIECTATERMQAYPYLATLLKEVGESVALKERLTIPKA